MRSYNTCRNRACRNEYGNSGASSPSSTRGAVSQTCSRASCLACLTDPGPVALECSRERAGTEFDAANGRRREHHALLVPEPGNVVIDDGRQILRHRHVCQPRCGSSVLAAPRRARY